MLITLFAARGPGPAWLPGESLVAFVLSGVLYVASRIVVGRLRKKSWTEILSDGWTPATGSIWLDGALFAAILIAIGIVIWVAMWLL